MKTIRCDSEEFNYSIRCKVDDKTLTQNEFKCLEFKIFCIRATLNYILNENEKLVKAFTRFHRTKLFLTR